MQIDTPMQLYNNPANKFVAGFIGSPTMNFIKVFLKQEGNYYLSHETEECHIDLGAEIPASLQYYHNKQLLIGIRPEDIVVWHDSAAACDCTLTVMAYENMGNEQLIYLSMANQTIIARRPPADSIAIGTEVGISFLKDKIIYINEANEAVITAIQ